MGKMNIGKMLAGGLVAGIVMNAIDYAINMYLMKSSYDAVMQARNIPLATAGSGSAIVGMMLLDFAMAILLVFLYVAIRPRFGAGPKTAIVSALTVSAVSAVTAAYFVEMGFFPWGVWGPATIASTVNFVIAGLVGAAIYQE
jgi:hypothetical protein